MNSNGYPFMTRRKILERIEADPAFAAECLAVIQERHDHRSADVGASMGWMASHAAKATKLAAKLAAGEATEKERADAAQLVKSYAKQLARVFRDRELAARPDLAAQAAVFGVGGGGQPAPVTPSATPESGELAPVPKRRGRPKGSKNRPKDSPKPTRRRRA